MFLTKSDSLIIGNIAKILGFIMDAIFNFLDKITGGHPNSGVAIIIMTFIIYMLMTPLTYRQQKFSKLQAKMMPEIQKIQARYKGRKDQDSMMAMNEETKEIYAKYGVSPTGSCVQLIIQMPILFALYRVLNNIPAYVTKVHAVFDELIDGLLNKVGIAESSRIMETLSSYSMYSKQFANENFAENINNYAGNTFIDVLNRASTADWNTVANSEAIVKNSLTGVVESTQQALLSFNKFLGLNIGDSPLFSIRNNGGSIGVIIMAILIPLLAALTQYLSVKMMPQAENSGNSGNSTADTMANQMKMMNTTMPLMSAVFCFTLPAGLGLYWIAGAVIRTIQQMVINRHIDKMNIDEILAQNAEKAKSRPKKTPVNKETGARAVSEKKFVEYSTMNTKKIGKSALKAEETDDLNRILDEKGRQTYKKGSLSDKVNMVNRYNNRSNH